MTWDDQLSINLHGNHRPPQQGRLNDVKGAAEFKGHGSESAPLLVEMGVVAVE